MAMIHVEPWLYYGKVGGRELPTNVDFVNVVDDDLGFTADLVDGTNNFFETSLPYPAEWDQDTEVTMLHQLKGWGQDGGYADGTGYQLGTSLSYLDRRPASLANYRGLKLPANEEYQKSLFAPNMKLGRLQAGPATGFLGAGIGNIDYGFHYTPEIRGGLSMFFPIYMEMWNQNFTLTTPTMVETEVNFEQHDRLIYQYHYTIRRMTRRESDFWNSLSGLPMRWSQLSN